MLSTCRKPQLDGRSSYFPYWITPAVECNRVDVTPPITGHKPHPCNGQHQIAERSTKRTGDSFKGWWDGHPTPILNNYAINFMQDSRASGSIGYRTWSYPNLNHLHTTCVNTCRLLYIGASRSRQIITASQPQRPIAIRFNALVNIHPE